MSNVQTLTEDENTAMRILWDRGGASVGELSMATRRPAGETLAMLRRLRRKGAVDRHRTGRDIVYRPRLNRETARTHALGGAVKWRSRTWYHEGRYTREWLYLRLGEGATRVETDSYQATKLPKGVR